MSALGWLVNVQRSTGLDTGDKQGFVVNLFVPWGNSTGAQYSDRSEWKRSELYETEGREWPRGFLYPWRWQDASWAIYKKTEANKWQRVETEAVSLSKLPSEDESKPLIAALEKELEDRTKPGKNEDGTVDDPHLLSVAEEHHPVMTQNSYCSLAHILAPMTHLPALLSSGVFKMSWMLRVETDGLNDTDAFIALPAFRLGESNVDFGKQTTSEDDFDALRFSAASPSENIDIAFLVRSVGILAKEGENPEESVATQLDPLGQWESIFEDHFSLPRIVLDVLAKQFPKGDKEKNWTESLDIFFRALGDGFLESKPQDSQGAHILDFVPEVTKELEQGWKTLLRKYVVNGELQSRIKLELGKGHFESMRPETFPLDWRFCKAWLLALLSESRACEPSKIADIRSAFETLGSQEALIRRLCFGRWSVMDLDLEPGLGGEELRKSALDEKLKANWGKIFGDIYESIKAFLESVVQDRAANVKEDTKKITQQKDAGIAIQWNGKSHDAESIRGYAIALRCGLPDAEKWILPQWITNTAIAWKVDNAKPELLPTSARPLTAHRTEGAYDASDRTIGDVLYSGRPLGSVNEDASGEDADGYQVLGYAWPSAWDYPPLGYGLRYQAIVTPLDNAGVVMQSEFRGDSPAELKAPETLTRTEDWSDPSEVYLCRQTPNEVPIQYFDATRRSIDLAPLAELTTETLAYAELSAAEIKREEVLLSAGAHALPLSKRDKQKVYLLRHPDVSEWFSGIEEVELKLSPPTVDREFLERWIATDYVRKKMNKADGLTPGLGNAKNLLDKLRSEAEIPKNKDGSITLEDWEHPVVSAIGVRLVKFKNGDKSIVDEKSRFSLPLSWTEGATRSFKKGGCSASLVVQSGDASVFPTEENPHSPVTIAPGDYVAIELYALIKDSWFAGDYARFDDTLGSTLFKGHRAFGPKTQVFEVAPYKGIIHSPPELRVGIKTQRLDENVAILLDGGLDHKFIGGIKIAPHPWRWSGLPVHFPDKEDDFDRWIVAYAGSSNPNHETSLALPYASWPGGKSLASFPLPEGAGAKAMAYVATPVPRFASRFITTSAVKSKKSAAIVKVPGRPDWSEDGRLPAPTLLQTIPLTFTLDEKTKERDLNGNLLVFAEAMYRTDEMARYGGIGESLEIELVDTRVSGIKEIGVNPIMHKNISDPTLGVKMGTPFGLTEDMGLFGLPGQTAVVLHPTVSESALGKWLMAKIRMRSLLLPDLLQQPGSETNLLRFRMAAKNWVPWDFVVDTAKVDEQKIILKDEDGFKYAINRPEGENGQLLVTWHFGRWGGGGDPTWRPQVILKKPLNDRLGWTEAGRKTCFDQDDYPWAHLPTAPQVSIEGDPAITYPLISDYTEATWTTFIGSFGTRLSVPEKYRIVKTADNAYELQEKNSDTNKWEPCGFSLSTPKAGVCFQLLMVLRPIADQLRGEQDPHAGALIGWAKVKAGATFEALAAGLPELKPGDRAYLLSFQKVNATNSVEQQALDDAVASWDEIQKQMFPSQDKEALIRILPEYLGPIKIDMVN